MGNSLSSVNVQNYIYQRRDEEVENPEQLEAGAQPSTDVNNRALVNGNLIISLGPARRGVLDGERLFGLARGADLASYFPFGNRMAPVAPPIHQTVTIKSEVNLHKESVQLVRSEANPNVYTLQFSFDATHECQVTVFFVATETTDAAKRQIFQGQAFGPITAAPGFGLKSSQFATAPFLDITSHTTEQLSCNPATHQYPVIITLDSSPFPSTEVQEDAHVTVNKQITYCTLLHCQDDSYAIKVLRQKIDFRGQGYVVHDIYGLDHSGERENEGSRECVVCLSAPRDATVLPCRHFCLCTPCAELMRTQTNKCPICRAPVGSLLSIAAAKEKGTKTTDLEEEDELITHKHQQKEDTSVTNV